MVCMLPEPRIGNMETGEVRKDRVSGETMYQVGIVAMRGRDSSVIQVTIVGEPAGLSVGMQVRLAGLEGSPWERDGRSGVAWRAGSVAPAGAGGPDVAASLAGGRRSAGGPGAAGATGRTGDAV
jgi:hypothetical protein